jgi:iron-sulfur cluster insertion protein
MPSEKSMILNSRACYTTLAFMSQIFTISESARGRIAHLLATEPAGARLRVAVEGGGCSGFQYKLDFDTRAPADDDALFGEVVVDATSLEYLKDSMLDYVESLGTASFEIRNPHATAKCGCGNSFSL